MLSIATKFDSPLPDVEQLEADLTRVLAPVLSSNLVFPIFGHSERRSRLEFVSVQTIMRETRM